MRFLFLYKTKKSAHTFFLQKNIPFDKFFLWKLLTSGRTNSMIKKINLFTFPIGETKRKKKGTSLLFVF